MAAISTPGAAELAIDANALGNLRAQARAAPASAAGKVAGQFEALFVQMLLKQMRDSVPQDGPLSSDTMKSYTAMFDQQIAQQLSTRGIGLRQVIEQQLARQLGATAAGADTPAAKAGSPTTGAAPGNLTISPGTALRMAPKGESTMPAPAPAQRSGTSLLPPAVDAFIEKLRPHAEAAARASGIPVQYLLAQAGLETGWGKSLPRTATGDTSHNLFGIKAGAQWKGAIADAATREVVAGDSIRTVQRFRAYGSFTDAFKDFAALLRDSARFSGVMAKTGDARAYAEGLQRAGYATDPHYAAKLARSIELVSRKLGPADAAVQLQAGAADISRAVS